MILIARVNIEGFRSIRQAAIENFGNLTAFAGLNNSGKSNVLRALNAFFNGETNAGEFIDVDGDYYRPDLGKKRRKRIRIAVTFSLPDAFKFRSSLEPVEDLLGSRDFEITKEWTRGKLLPALSLNGKALDLEEQQKIDQFLGLVKYRYIPNRVLPTELIRNEHQSLRDVLVRRLARRAKRDQAAFDAIRDASNNLIESLASRFAQACPGQGTVALATPTSWHDMAFAFGYRLAQGDVEIDDIAQGSGIQSLLMLETLYLIDRDYFQQFGWRQAAVWGVEEPESSLHSSLEARVAAYLSTVSSEPTSRLQVLCTTHSDLMVQHADRTIIVEQGGNGSSFDCDTESRAALIRLSRAGVSRWVHPLLFFPLGPVIIVEGKQDHRYFTEAFRFIRPGRRVHVTYLEEMGVPDASGGVDRIQKYIKENADAIQARTDNAPVIVVLDWDSRGKLDGFRKLIKSSAPYHVLAWPDDALNPNLGTSFHGIERALPDRIIKKAIRSGADIGTKTDGQFIVQRDDYSNVKNTLAKLVAKGLRAPDFREARTFILEILDAAGAKP